MERLLETDTWLHNHIRGFFIPYSETLTERKNNGRDCWNRSDEARSEDGIGVREVRVHDDREFRSFEGSRKRLRHPRQQGDNAQGRCSFDRELELKRRVPTGALLFRFR